MCGNIVIIDKALIDVTNLNRNLMADTKVVGKYKVDVASIDHVENSKDGYSKLVIDLEEKYGNNKNDSEER